MLHVPVLKSHLHTPTQCTHLYRHLSLSVMLHYYRSYITRSFKSYSSLSDTLRISYSSMHYTHYVVYQLLVYALSVLILHLTVALHLANLHTNPHCQYSSQLYVLAFYTILYPLGLCHCITQPRTSGCITSILVILVLNLHQSAYRSTFWYTSLRSTSSVLYCNQVQVGSFHYDSCLN
jgi:hypothetical protein